LGSVVGQIDHQVEVGREILRTLFGVVAGLLLLGKVKELIV